MKKEKKLNKQLMAGLFCVGVVLLNKPFGFFTYVFPENVCEFINGFLLGLGIVLELIGVYNIKHEVPFKQKKKEVLNKIIRG